MPVEIPHSNLLHYVLFTCVNQSLIKTEFYIGKYFYRKYNSFLLGLLDHIYSPEVRKLDYRELKAHLSTQSKMNISYGIRKN